MTHTDPAATGSRGGVRLLTAAAGEAAGNTEPGGADSLSAVKSWLAVFSALFGMLVLRNRFLFSTPIHELGDTGANSILVNQAKHFALLVGNYSRQGFNHPGPAYFYIQAAGEWLLHDVLGVVPAPWNGQVMALYALNAALFATITLIIQRWTQSWAVAGFALLVMVALICHTPQIINNAWMPYVYVPSFLLFLVACASVATGKTEHLWAIALAGGLLINGHAVFLLFVPVTAGAAIWMRLRAGPIHRRDWTIGLAVLAPFLLPMLVNTVWHWPGEFGKYLGYGGSDRAGSKSLFRSMAYVYWYWWPTRIIWLAVLGVPIVTAIVYAATRIKEPFVRSGLVLGGLVTALLLFYAFAGIDHLGDPYMGFFYWGVPLFVGASFAIALRARLARVPAAVPMAGVVLLMLVVPGFRTITNDDEPSVPAALAKLKAYSSGRPVIVDIAGDDIGPEVPGLLGWARRDGLRACVRDENWAFITTREFVCTPADLAGGVAVTRWKVDPKEPALPGEVARAGTSALVSGSAGVAS